MLQRASLVPFAATVALTVLSFSASAQTPRPTHPIVFANDTKGNRVRLEKGDLANFELALCDRFNQKDAPDEIIAFATGRPYSIFIPELGEPVSLLTISVDGNEGELRWYLDDTAQRHYHRDMSAEEVAGIRRFLNENQVDTLPELSGDHPQPDGQVTSIVGGTQHVYLRLTSQQGLRIPINNPHRTDREPLAERAFRYVEVTNFFETLMDADKLEMRYTFRRPMKGLEVVYVPEPDTDVLTVWQQGCDICVTLQKKWGRDRNPRHFLLRDGRIATQVDEPQKTVENKLQADDAQLRPACLSPDGRWVVGNRWEDAQLLCYDRQERKFDTSR